MGIWKSVHCALAAELPSAQHNLRDHITPSERASESWTNHTYFRQLNQLKLLNMEKLTQSWQVRNIQQNQAIPQPHTTLQMPQEQPRGVWPCHPMQNRTRLHWRLQALFPPSIPRPNILPLRQRDPGGQKSHHNWMPKIQPTPKHTGKSIKNPLPTWTPRHQRRNRSAVRIPQKSPGLH